MKLSKTAHDGGSVMETRRKQAVILRGFPMGSSVIQRVNFGNPSPAHIPSIPNLPLILLSNPESRPSNREIVYLVKPIEDPLLNMPACLNLAGVKISFFDSYLISIFFLESIRRVSHLSTRKCTIDISCPLHNTSATCTLDSHKHSKTPPSGLDLAQSVERFK